jgi:hypothetical protein
MKTQTQIPGAKARHAIVTDACREKRGDIGALEEAISRILATYLEVVAGWPVGKGVRIHLALTVERPSVSADQVPR